MTATVSSKHIPYRGTEEQRANLLRLASYLMRKRKDYDHFDMGAFFRLEWGQLHPEAQAILLKREKVSVDFFSMSDDVRIEPPENHFETHIKKCGAVACAIGHGPLAGIAVDKDKTWNAYALRAFGTKNLTNAWSWCFTDSWQNTDNTPKGAARRILYMLEYGVPVQPRGWRGGFCIDFWNTSIYAKMTLPKGVTTRLTADA